MQAPWRTATARERADEVVLATAPCHETTRKSPVRRLWLDIGFTDWSGYMSGDDKK